MTSTSSGTIDGITYASSQYIYDGQGDGVVLDIFYYDQTGGVVADQTIYQFSQIPHSAPITNADGTFSIKVTPAGGTAPPYVIDTFSSAGIWIREDDYAPVYADPNNPSGGITGYAETGYTLINATGTGSSGSIDGVYYDTVTTTYTASGRLTETDYYSTLSATHQLVERVYSPNPSLALAATGTATAGTADTPLYASFTDPWAAQHAGSLGP